MKFFALLSAVTLYFVLPSTGLAQNTGQIECARSDDYVYLYSSMTTLQVRATLQCGEIVSITLRYDYYYGVRTAKDDNGFVSQSSVALIKDKAQRRAARLSCKSRCPRAHPLRSTSEGCATAPRSPTLHSAQRHTRAHQVDQNDFVSHRPRRRSS